MIPYWNSVAAGSNFEDETGTLVGTLLILLALLLSRGWTPWRSLVRVSRRKLVCLRRKFLSQPVEVVRRITGDQPRSNRVC